MTYSYSGPLTYGTEQTPLYYEYNQPQKSSSAPAAAFGGVVGVGTGAFVGCKKNPFITKSGEVTDTFTKKVYEKYIKKNDQAAKKIYEQTNTILQKINGVKTSEELHHLLDSNKEGVKNFLSSINKTLDEYIGTVTADNLSANKGTIKKSIESFKQNKFQNAKNVIQSCWNKEKRCFEKPDSVSNEIFSAIKKSTSGAKAGLVAKFALIGGAIGMAAGYIMHKLLTLKNSAPQQ